MANGPTTEANVQVDSSGRAESPFSQAVVQTIVDAVGPVKMRSGNTEKLDPITLKQALDRAYDWYIETRDMLAVVEDLPRFRDKAKTVMRNLRLAAQRWSELPDHLRRAFEIYEGPRGRRERLDVRLYRMANVLESFLSSFKKDRGNQAKYAVMPLQEFTITISGYWDEYVAEPFSWAFDEGIEVAEPVPHVEEQEPTAPSLKLLWESVQYIGDGIELRQCVNAIRHVRRRS